MPISSGTDRSRRAWRPARLAVLPLLLVTSCSDPTSQESDGATDTVTVGVVTSLSGPLEPYGRQFLAGVRAGVDFATEGTGEVDGTSIELVEADDASDSARAVAAVTEQIGDGARIITGNISSGIGLAEAPLAEQNQILFIAGPGSSDALTGINSYTFRSGRQTYQDVLTARSFLGDPQGKSILVFSQDSAFGESNVASVTSVLGGEGAEVQSILVPVEATDITPFAAEAKAVAADMVLVAWVGDSSAAMWRSLDQQGVFDTSQIVSILDVASAYPVLYPPGVAQKIGFLGHYFDGVTDNEMSQALATGLEGSGQEPDIYTNDGFVAGLMIVRAVGEGGTDVDAMISALEGWSFDGPKGEMTVRAEDHALLQPMFKTVMQVNDGTYTAMAEETLDAMEVAPPVVDMK